MLIRVRAAEAEEARGQRVHGRRTLSCAEKEVSLNCTYICTIQPPTALYSCMLCSPLKLYLLFPSLTPQRRGGGRRGRAPAVWRWTGAARLQLGGEQ